MMEDDKLEGEGLDDEELFANLVGTLTLLKENKPTERSERARHYAVALTEMEKVVAYFATYVYHLFGTIS